MDRGDQIKLSGHKRLLFTASDKPPKGRIKSLSAVSNRSFEEKMVGCHVSQLKREVEDDGENGTIIKTKKKRLKLPKERLADDSPGAYCSSVPRKLRSAAMRKRKGESLPHTILGSKKWNGVSGGLKLSEKDSGKKLKLNVKQGKADCIPSHYLHEPITKDEKEVVEALYALAGMFDQQDECNKRSKVDDTGHSPLVPPHRSQVPSEALGVIYKETSMCSASQPAQDVERSFEVIANGHSPKQALPNSVESEKFSREIDGSYSQVTFDIRQSKLEEQKPVFSNSTPCTQQATNRDLDANNMKRDSKLGIVILNGKPDVALGLSTKTAPQVNFRDTASWTEKDVVWPGLDSIALGSPSSTRSLHANLPPWLDAALCVKKPSSLADCTLMKVPKVHHDQKSRKRCATHLYIGRMIQRMQLPKGMDSMPSNPEHPMPREVLNPGEPLSMNCTNSVRGDLIGSKSNHDAIGANGKHAKDSARFTPEQHKHSQEQIHGTVALGTPSSANQTFNFLSLSTDGGGMEANYYPKVVKYEVQTSKRQPVPPHNSRTQQSTAIPFSLSQSYPSPAYLHQPPTTSASWQAQHQPPSYVSHSFGVCHANNYLLTKQHNEQRKQQEYQHQQRLWDAHMAAQYRIAGASTPMNQYQYPYHVSQNGRRPDFSMVMPCVKPGAGGHLSLSTLSAPKHRSLNTSSML